MRRRYRPSAKRTHLPHVPAAVDEASLEALAAGISTYFRRTEGRGTHCVVEPVRRGTLDYFFAYPEDYAQHRVEWVDGQFGQRPHHPGLRGHLRLFASGRQEPSAQ